MANKTVKRVKTLGRKVPRKYESKKMEVEEVLKVENESWWVYVLLLSTIVILAQSLKDYTFSFDNITLTYSIFVLPIVYFVTNYITKKYGYTKSIVGISVSGVSLVLFSLIMSFVIGTKFSFYDICGGFCGYVVSQFVNLTIYQFLLVNTNNSFVLIYLTYLFAFVVNYLFYTLIYMNLLVFDNYWISYFTTLIIQGILCFLLTFFDVNIKRGIEV
ncbi:MAG TPA: VUT family protein [Candidatus Faecimonas gallistercoris]|nr:VUT family protein [Candidatus Faecimonas gallistercoris]